MRYILDLQRWICSYPTTRLDDRSSHRDRAAVSSFPTTAAVSALLWRIGPQELLHPLLLLLGAPPLSVSLVHTVKPCAAKAFPISVGPALARDGRVAAP